MVSNIHGGFASKVSLRVLHSKSHWNADLSFTTPKCSCVSQCRFTRAVPCEKIPSTVGAHPHHPWISISQVITPATHIFSAIYRGYNAMKKTARTHLLSLPQLYVLIIHPTRLFSPFFPLRIKGRSAKTYDVRPRFPNCFGHVSARPSRSHSPRCKS